jgi:hypothetical protein
VNPDTVRLFLRIVIYMTCSASYIEVDIVFGSTDSGGRDMHSSEPNTFTITITVSADAGPSLTGVVNTQSPMAAHIPVAEGSSVRHTVSTNTEAMQLTSLSVPISPSSQKGDLPIESGASVLPVADRPLSDTDTPRATLRRAEEAINTIKTWNSAVNVVKLVMDTVGPIAAVCPESAFNHSC